MAHSEIKVQSQERIWEKTQYFFLLKKKKTSKFNIESKRSVWNKTEHIMLSCTKNPNKMCCARLLMPYFKKQQHGESPTKGKWKDWRDDEADKRLKTEFH